MDSRKSAALLGAALLTVAAAAPVAAQPTIEVLAEGLAGPRGVAIAADGSIYVAEAGTGGDVCPNGESGTCYGPTAAITRIADGAAERVVEGLPSAANAEGTFGISDLVALDDGSLLMVVNLGADPATRTEGSAYGWLGSVAPGGELTPVVDVAGFESTANPDAEWAPTPDSNPHSLALIEGGTLIADAGGNSLLLAGDDGVVSLVAVLPPTIHEYPPEVLAAMGPPPGAEGEAPPPEGAEGTEAAAAEGEAMAEGEAGAESGPPELIPVPVESVPTSVTVGPDDAYYVGQLTGGPFPAGGASVYRIVPGAAPEVYATGFSAIMDIGFGSDGTLYVAELVHDGLLGVFTGQAPPIGAIMSVPPGGGEPVMVASGEQLMAPGGLAVADDGSLIVSTNTLMPGAGAVVKVTP